MVITRAISSHSAYLLLAFVFLAVVTAKRVSLPSNIAADWTLQQFGVTEVVVDKTPRSSEQAEEERPLLEPLILLRLNDLRRNPNLADERDYQCYISMNAIVDDAKQVPEGGLAVVIQKMLTQTTSFRINFYETETLRTWLEVRSLDIPVNRFFADEKDVWVLRLLKAGMQSLPLPNLQERVIATGTPMAADNAQVVVDGGEESLTYMMHDRERILQAVPHENEIFKFSLDTNGNRLLNTNEWRCRFRVAHFGNGPRRLLAFEDTRRFLQATGRRFNGQWMVSDASNSNVFSMVRESGFGEHRYRIRPENGGRALFTLGLTAYQFRYYGDIWKGTSNEPIINILQVNESYHFNCASTGRLRAKLISNTDSRYRDYTVKVYAHADVVLMLMSAAGLANELR